MGRFFSLFLEVGWLRLINGPALFAWFVDFA